MILFFSKRKSTFSRGRNVFGGGLGGGGGGQEGVKFLIWHRR